MVYLRLPIKTWWFSSQWLYSPHSSGPPVWDPFRTLQKSIGIPLVNGFFDRVSLEFPWTPYRNPIKNPLTHWEPRKKNIENSWKKLRSFLLRIPPQRHCPIRRATRQRSVAAGHAEDVAVAVQLTGAESLQGHHGWAHMCILLRIWYMIKLWLRVDIYI